MIRWLLFTTAVFAAAGQQIAVPPSVPYLRVHGEVTRSERPDRVQLDVGVVSQAATSEAAADLNGKQSKAVLDSLRQLLPAGNIQTVNFSVNPNYQYPKDGSVAVIQGYTANNTVRLQVDDFVLMRKLIEAATKAGASDVNRINFVLRDETRARAAALGDAADQARAGAVALAERLNVKLGRLLRIEEEQPVIISAGRQVALAAPAKGADRDSRIEPGSIDVHAAVILTFEVIQ